MSKRLAASHTDCPAIRKARTITDYYQLKNKPTSLNSSTDDLLRDAAHSDDDPGELKEQDDDTVSPSPYPEPLATLSTSTLMDSSGRSVRNPILDVGELVKISASSEQLESAIHSLTNSEKYQYLTEHFKPSKEYRFPSTYMNKCNRSFQHKWLTKYPWLVYSPELDGGFCLPCFFFATNRSAKGVLVNSAFTRWTKVTTTLGSHATLEYHLESLTKADAFKCGYEDPEKTIRGHFNKELVEHIAKNRLIMERIVRAILYLGKQGLALRGRGEDPRRGSNPGNFLSLLHLMAESDEVLRNHLHAPQRRNATYISPQSQNEIINVIGKDFIQHQLLCEIKEAKFYAVLADEVTCHNVEQMPLCIRFVDKNCNIREEFLEFVPLKRVTGIFIGEAILSKLEEWQLPAEDMRGQGYDGAKSMSSDRVGCQAIVRQQAPLAVYTHCSDHCLNLVVAGAFKLPNVRNTVDTIREIGLFFNSSPKREGLLIEVINKHPTFSGTPSKRKPLIDMCRTRWVERIKAFAHFYQAFVFLEEALGIMASPGTDESYPDFQDWDNDTKTKACSLLKALDFEFLMSFTTTYRVLAIMEGITTRLQCSSIDIYDAFCMVRICLVYLMVYISLLSLPQNVLLFTLQI